MESTNSLAYLEDYLDSKQITDAAFEALPLEVTRQLTLIREHDSKCHNLLLKTSLDTPNFLERLPMLDKEEKEIEIKRLTSAYKELIADGQQKVALASETYDIVERHIRRMDADINRFEDEQMTGPKLAASKPDHRYYQEKPVSSRPKRERKAEELYREESPKITVAPPPPSPPPRKVNPPRVIPTPPVVQAPIVEPLPVLSSEIEIEEVRVAPPPIVDPNEPTYCFCNQCDNEECEKEWFHSSCLKMTEPPTGTWYCPACTSKGKVI